MHPIILKTFGGMPIEQYFRHFFFGALVALAMFASQSHSPSTTPAGMIVFIVINTIIYPYSRYAIQVAGGFLMGDNAFFAHVGFILIVKTIITVLCWIFAIFMAPIGLMLLYAENSKKQPESER